MTVAVVVVAAGSGTRLGLSTPKAFVPLNGVPVLEWALRGVLGCADVTQVVVVAPSAQLADAHSIVQRTAGAVAQRVTVVAGGETRQRSVAAGLAVLEPGIRTVLVHDAARALTPPALFDQVVHAVEVGGHGVVPALPVSDTIKRVGSTGVIVQTVDRRDLVHVQTPQGFPRAGLDAAYAAVTEERTDDAAVFTASGGEVATVLGDALAFKITTPWDMRRAQTLLGGGPGIRTGVGVDVHAYDDGSPLWLGGLYWPDEPGLAGHSDGDAACHAICDALLSAAGLGDLGDRFGTADPRFAAAHGELFIRETLALVAGAGYAVGNVVVQVIANRPKIARRRAELEARLTALVGAPVSVSATTSDGLGFTGRGEGVTAIATALLLAQH